MFPVAIIRVLIVDDHRLVAESIARLMKDYSDLQVVGLAGSGPEAISLARHLIPSVILMDIGLPGMDGVDATWTLKRQFPAIPVLMLTMFDHEAYAIESLRAGASGYLVKTAGPDDLVQAIHAVCAGKPVLPPHIASAALQRLATRGRLHARDPFALTQREIQILQLMVGGLDALEISRRLVLSPHTVRNHLKSVYKKLGVHDRTEAAIHAYRQGIAKA